MRTNIATDIQNIQIANTHPSKLALVRIDASGLDSCCSSDVTLEMQDGKTTVQSFNPPPVAQLLEPVHRASIAVD
jgi:hypothetical protein